jgi:hypothetical protein
MSQILTSAPPSPQKTPLSETLEARTQRIREKLRAQRAQSELIYDIASEMLEIDRLGLWQAATGTDAPVEKKTKKKKTKKTKKNALTREVWAKQTFGISLRQARKYFNVAEHLRREEIAGSGLCLDRMEQLALCPPALRPTLLALGSTEGLPASALSAGRRAAAPLLQEGDSAAAIAAAIEVARDRARKEDREDQKEGGKRRGKPEGSDADAGPDAGYACELVAAAQQQIEGLVKLAAQAAQDGPSAPIDLGALAALAEAAERLGESTRRLLAQIAASGDPPAPEVEAPPAPPAPAVQQAPAGRPPAAGPPPQPHQGGARKSTSARISFTPLVAVLFTLGHADREKMQVLLHAAMTDLPFSTAEIAAALRKAGAEPALVLAWEDLLNRPTHEERARFAFWFAQKVEPRWLNELLRFLDRERLPRMLREHLEKEGLGREVEVR